MDDDPRVRRFLQQGLEAEAHLVDVAASGRAAQRALAGQTYELVLLDHALPDQSGLELLRRLLGMDPRPNTIVISRYREARERVRALDAGADDYLTKPFSFVELGARIRAIRRRRRNAETLLQVGELRLDTSKQTLTCGTKPVRLTRRELQLLEHLMRQAGQVVTRAALTMRVWGRAHDPASNVIDVYVGYLRKKLSRGGVELRTIRGAGWILLPVGAGQGSRLRSRSGPRA